MVSSIQQSTAQEIEPISYRTQDNLPYRIKYSMGGNLSSFQNSSINFEVNLNLPDSKIEVMNSNIEDQIREQNQLPGEHCARRELSVHREGPKKLQKDTLRVVSKFNSKPTEQETSTSPKNLFFKMIEQQIAVDNNSFRDGNSSISPDLKSTNKGMKSQLMKSHSRMHTNEDMIEESEPILHPHEKMFKPQIYKPTRFSKSLVDQQEFYCQNKKRGIKKLCEEVIDKEIQLKPYKLQSKVLEQAIHQGKDIDQAAMDYQKFLENKEKIRNAELLRDKISKGLDSNDSALQVKQKLSVVEQEKLNSDYLNIKDKIHKITKTEHQKITQKRAIQELFQQGLLSDKQAEMKKSDFVLTYQKAIDPLNIFYRREIKKATNAKKAAQAYSHLKIPGLKDEIMAVTNSEKNLKQHVQDQTFIVGQYAKQILDQVANMPLTYKQEFAQKRTQIEKEAEEKRKEEAIRKNREILEMHKINYKLEPQTSRRSEPGATARSVTKKAAAAVRLRGIALFQQIMKKHKAKFTTMVAFSVMANKYKSYYRDLIANLGKDEVLEGRNASINNLVDNQNTFEMMMLTTYGSISSESEDEQPAVLFDRNGRRIQPVVKKEEVTEKTQQELEKDALIEFANEYLKTELRKIYTNRQAKMAKGVEADAKFEVRNQQFQEMYRDMTIEKQISDVIKAGEKGCMTKQSSRRRLRDEHASATQEDVDLVVTNPLHLEEVSKEQIIIDHANNAYALGANPLPVVFSKIENNTFSFQAYNLSTQYLAISSALGNNKNKFNLVRTLQLDDCRLGDVGFSLVLQGLIKQDFLEHISYSNDEFGPESLKQLIRLRELEQASKTSKLISELSFQALQITLDTLRGLMELISNTINLKKLKFTSINLSDVNVFRHLVEFLRETEQQTMFNTLQLSNCSFKSRQILEITEALLQTLSLQNLNLSRNHLSNKETTATVMAPNKKGKLVKKEVQINDEEQFCKNMAQIIKQSKALIHLNLNEMNLTSFASIIQSEGITQSKSLMAVHLSNNILSDQLKFDFNTMVEDLKKNTLKLLIRRSSASCQELENDIAMQKTDDLVRASDPRAQVNISLKKIQERHRDQKLYFGQSENSVERTFLINSSIQKSIRKSIIYNNSETFNELRYTNKEEDIYLFTRKLGFLDLLHNKTSEFNTHLNQNTEMFHFNANSKWINETAEHDCFMCNKSNMVHIFFRRQDVTQDFQKITNLHTISVIKEYYGLNQYRQTDSRIPIVLGSVSEWAPVKMMPILYFMLLQLCNNLQRSRSGIVKQNTQKIREHIVTSMNSEQINRKDDFEISHGLNGWSSFLYDQVEQFQSSDDGQVFNFPYLNQPFSQVNRPLQRYINKHDELEALRKKKAQLEAEKKANPDTYDGLEELKLPTVKQINIKYAHPKNFRDWKQELEHLEMLEMEDCFVFSDLIKPGTQSVIVYDPKSDELYWKEISIRARTKPHYAPNFAKRQIQRQGTFENETENMREIRKKVFKAFRDDSTSVLKLAFLKDTNPDLFKPYKFIKLSRDIEECLKLIHDNFKIIKDAFIILSCENRCYPNIDENFFAQFCIENGIIDKLFTAKDLSKIFVETNFEYVEDADDMNPDDLLNRSEFLEIFMRIAVYKNNATIRKNVEDQIDVQKELDMCNSPRKQEEILNRQPSEVLSPADWMKIFINKMLRKLSESEDISGFRTKMIQNDSFVCNVIMKNYTSLTKMYNSQIQKFSVFSNKGGHFDIQSATRLLRVALINDEQLQDITLLKCFAFSKMTVINEMVERMNYFRLEFVEFLEFLCRIAFQLYQADVRFTSDTSIYRMLEQLLSILCKSQGLSFITIEEIMLESQFLDKKQNESDDD